MCDERPDFISLYFFFFNDTATTEIYTLSLHDALRSLGSHNDEERSEMRYVMRIAGLRESSKF